MVELDARRSEVLGRSASIIQRKIRAYLGRKNYILLRVSATQIQAVCRGQLARQIYERLRREAASLTIQRSWRMYHSRKKYIQLCSSAISIQTGLRVMTARNDLRLRRQTKAAVIIQSQWRRYMACMQYTRIKKAAITTQSAWRGRVARKELRKLKMAAKETGALQEAKNKLEKQVEELTWRLQLEKRIRSDMEEAKTQENAKLQSALQEMQLQCKETKALLEMEREAAKQAVEKAPVVQEIPIIDTAMLDKLTIENEKLKFLVGALEKKIEETEQKYEETSRESEERLKQALDAETKIIQLKTDMQRLDEKLLDMESENEILRQQTLNTPVKRMSEHLSIPRPKGLANGHHEKEEIAEDSQSGTPINRYGSESENKLRRSQIERQHENVNALIKCVMQDIGFSQGKPVAAFTIYRCLLTWKLFEAEKTSVFDRLIQMIGSAIENQENNDHLAYWLSNTSTLLFLVRKSLIDTGTAGSLKPQPQKSLFGRMTQGFRSSPSSANLSVAGQNIVRQVEAKHPAMLFRDQLQAYAEKIFGIIRENLKKELASSLSSCIQAPRTSKGSALRSSGRSFGNSSSTNYWRTIIDSLNSLLSTLQENFVPPLLIQKIFIQIFSYINVQLFNSLLLRRECCTFSNGEYVKAGLAELEIWCAAAKQEYAGSSWDELKHIRQAVGFLVIHQKSRISYDEIINDLCPILSVQQLYRICTLYWDDNYNTRSVSQDVISSMRVLMTEDSTDAESSSFLLDDDVSNPFTPEDISNALQEKDFVDVKPAAELLENQAFQFLHV